MAGVHSLEVYEVEIEELYDGMFWSELDGSVPEKKNSNNSGFLHISLVLKTFPG